MTERESRPAQAAEEKIRDAFRDAAQTLTAEDLPGPPSAADRARPARGPRASRAQFRGLVPLAAAAGVVAIAVSTTLVLPTLRHQPAGGPAAGLAGAPAFFAGISGPGRAQNAGTRLSSYSARTGRIIASVHPPRPGQEFEAVARLGSDRTYVAAAEDRAACTTWLYWFSIGAAGRPGRLVPLAVPKVTGHVLQLTGSADGQVLAYAASGRCTPGSTSDLFGAIHPATGQQTTWTYPARTRAGHPTVIGGLSLTEDGSVLGIALRWGVWTLPTGSPAGPLARHARMVPGLNRGVYTAVLTSTGSRVYVETASYRHGPLLSLYSVASGRRLRSLARIGPGGPAFVAPPLALDADGEQLIMYGYKHLDGRLNGGGMSYDNRRMAEMNLATGHLTWITSAVAAPVTQPGLSTVAW